MYNKKIIFIFSLLVSLLFVQSVFADDIIDTWTKTTEEIVKLDNQDKIYEYLTDKDEKKDMNYVCKQVPNADRLFEYECTKEFTGKREIFIYNIIFDKSKRISELKADCRYKGQIPQNELSNIYMDNLDKFEKKEINKERHLANDIYKYIKDETGFRAYDIKNWTYILTVNNDPSKNDQYLRYTIIRDLADKIKTAASATQTSGNTVSRTTTDSGNSGSGSQGNNQGGNHS